MSAMAIFGFLSARNSLFKSVLFGVGSYGTQNHKALATTIPKKATKPQVMRQPKTSPTQAPRGTLRGLLR